MGAQAALARQRQSTSVLASGDAGGGMVKNSAFLFIKPHAVTDKVKDLVKETLTGRGINISSEGSIEAETIDKKMLIDRHYYAIAAKATLKKPTELNVPKDKFKEAFGVAFDDMVKEDKVFNAKDACEKFGVDSSKLDELWAASKKAKKLVKFGGGFYCAEISHASATLYVFNGFFMAMRAKFVTPGTSIYYYVVDFDSKTLSWGDFRGQVLGPTDPADAPKDSLRGMVSARWQDLGLTAACNTGDNAVHASASPFEGLAERMNWLGVRPDRDPFGKLLLKAGVSRGLIKEWSVDPQVTFGVVPITTSIFDRLEDTDTDYCATLCQMIASYSKEPDGQKASPLEAEVTQLRAKVAAYEEMAKAVNTILAFKPPSVAKPKAAPKVEPKASKTKDTSAAPKKEPSPEKKELFAKMAEIRAKRKALKKDGKSKEETDEAVAPLLEELKELKAKAKTSKDENIDDA